MSNIANENDFRATLSELDAVAQRVLAARFTENVLDLSDDNRIAAGVKVASDPGSSEAELASSFKTVKAATIESHTRCGSAGDWKAQAAYFVARACESALSPEGYKKGGTALQAATSARMARTAHSIDNDEEATHGEREAQYEILNDYMNKRGKS